MLSEVSVSSINNHKNFRKIHELVSTELGIDISKDAFTVNKALNEREFQTSIPDLRLNHNLMLEIEWNIAQILQDLKISKYSAMQFPANIRILNNLPKVEEDGSYRTTHLHCDSWSGAPQDTLNIFLGLFVSDGAPWLKMYKTFPPMHPAYSYVGPYLEAPVNEKELAEVLVPRKAGTLVMWPTQTPHKTHLSNANEFVSPPSWRISIDIRIRSHSPYLNENELTIENFSESKMNSLGVYWSKPLKQFKTVHEKFEYENEVLRNFSKNAKVARDLYVGKFYEE